MELQPPFKEGRLRLSRRPRNTTAGSHGDASSGVILSGLVLFVADLFHPVDRLAVELFVNGDVRHGRRWCSAVPMFLSRWDPDHIAGPDFLERGFPALRSTTSGRYDQRLP